MKAGSHEVVIIGSGAGGGAAAYGLAMKGVKVLVLEAGPKFDPFSDYNLSDESWEKTGFPGKAGSTGRQTFAPMQELDPARGTLLSWSAAGGRKNQTEQRLPFKYFHVRGVGGSTLAFTGEAHRLHPESMQMQSRFGVAADWPVDYATLEPFYSEAERVIGVAGPGDQGARYRSEPFPLPAHPLSYGSQKLAAGAESVGMKWEANSRAALSRPYEGRPDCNYCGNCNRGCPRTDKGSVDVTFLHKAVASGFCEVRSGVTVTRIEAGENDRVKGVHLVDAAGGEHFLSTPELIVSCGAVETPRLLLNSANSHAPEGLANESGQVGKNFMETLFWTGTGLHPDPVGSYRGLPADSISWDFNAPDAIEGVVGGCRFNAGVWESEMNGPIAYAQRIVGGWGVKHKKAMRDVFGRALTVGAIGESLPNPRSFIDLDPDQVDGNGMPLARIHSHLDKSELDRLEFMAAKSREILKAAGAGELVEEYGAYDFFSSTHVFGTCRMGIDPEASAVDSFGKSHRWKNLAVLDASVFPSSGGGESPSLTIEALALRNSAGIY
ncbi:GMC family oxidoreductase [Verrucomicrobiales bacterium BCK34]|nr:GMC family oxidoreductase [Verrucomicrobiales bacterium BCK34]